MKIVPSKDPFIANGFFKLKNKDWLERQRIAGKVASKSLLMLESAVKDKTTLSTLELSRLIEDFIISQNCSCSFKNYKGFPEAVCISVNNALVHGIPNDYKLQEGDVVKFDLGVTFEESMADCAITCIYGEPKKQDHVKLVKACEEALVKGIAAIKVGDMLGCIGNAIYKSAKGNGFNVITKYGGHGICNNDDGSAMPHAAPFVSNKSSPNDGFRFAPGLVLAIEPLLCIGSQETKVKDDNWTVITENINAHFENTIYVHENHVEIITGRD